MALERAVQDKVSGNDEGFSHYTAFVRSFVQIHGKRDPEQEKAAQEWIEAVTGEKFPSSDYGESLHDGILLCK